MEYVKILCLENKTNILGTIFNGQVAQCPLRFFIRISRGFPSPYKHVSLLATITWLLHWEERNLFMLSYSAAHEVIMSRRAVHEGIMSRRPASPFQVQQGSQHGRRPYFGYKTKLRWSCSPFTLHYWRYNGLAVVLTWQKGSLSAAIDMCTDVPCSVQLHPNE